ncbi:MAG: DUF6056 family protein [Lachnospiraceae bacterium]
MKEDQKRNLWAVILPSFLFFVFLSFMYSKVYIYYDDFGYLSLSYGKEIPEVMGDQFHLQQLLRFMAGHYEAANGRLLYMFLYLLTYLIGGLKGMQFAMALIVFGVMLLLYRQITFRGDVEHPWFAWLFFLLYGSIGILVQRHSSYWFAASFLYITPAIPFLLFVSCYSRVEEKISHARLAYLCMLAFLSGFSQEQWMVATWTAILCIWCWKLFFYKKNYGIREVLILLSAVLGGSVILTSPAVADRFAREGNAGFLSQGIFSRLAGNLKAIIELFTTETNRPYIYVFCVFLFLLSLLIWEQIRQRGRWQRGLAGFSCIYLASGLLSIPITGKIYYLYWIGYLLIAISMVLYACYRKQDLFGGILWISAGCSILCMMVVPELPTRLLIPFEFLSFYLFGRILLEIFDRKEWILSAAIALFLGSVCGSNLITIYHGYAVNDQVLKSNETIIENAVDAYEKEPKEMEILLQTQPDYLYGSDMMYLEAFAFMEGWVRQYYQLPEEIKIIYYEPNQ